MDSYGNIHAPCRRAPVLRLLEEPEEFEPARDAAQSSCLAALEKCPTPFWVYSALHKRIIWSNTRADTTFGRDLTAVPDEAKIVSSSALVRGNDELRRMVEENGYSVEISSPCSCTAASSIACWPQASVCQSKQFDCDGFGLSIDPIVMQKRHLGEGMGESQTCCLVQLKHTVYHNTDETARVLAMNSSCPIFKFMFDMDGKLMHANEKAMKNWRHHAGDEELTLWRLFKISLYNSDEERQMEYKEAMAKVFGKQQAFSCCQQRRSRKNPAQVKWVELEMWPMLDPVTGMPAVQINQMSRTRTKKAEDALKFEKDRLETTKEALEAQLKQTGKHRSLHIDSPMARIVDLFDNLMAGGPVPDRKTLMEYRHMVSTASNLGQPSDLIGELLDDVHLEKDVGLSILQQLGFRLGRNQKRISTSSAEIQQTPGGALMFAGDPYFTQSSREFSMSMDTLGWQSRSSPAASRLGSPFAADRSPERNASGNRMQPATGTSDLLPASVSSNNGPLAENPTLPTLAGPCVVPVVERVLCKSNDWDFNVFELNDVSQGNPLSVLGFFLLKQTGLVQYFRLDETKLSRWLRTVEDSYQNNNYHNRIHAADVTHSMYVMLIRGGLHKGLSMIQILATVLATIIHDVDHPGHTNDFIVNSEDALAVDYNDISPLENHHLAKAFKILKREEYNFLDKLDNDAYRAMRSLMIELVLATDMKRHFDILSQFQVGLSIQSKRQTSNAPRPLENQPSSGFLAEGVRQLWARIPDEEMDDAQHALKLKVALKVADLGHLAAPPAVHKRWVARLEEEFFRQGDREKELKLPVSPLMDRNKPGITCAQLGFFEVVAMPLFNSLVTAYSSCRPLLEALEENYNMWAEPDKDGVDAPKMRKRLNTV